VLVGFWERQFLEEGRLSYCSVSVLWRDGGTAGWADWVSLLRAGAVGSEGKVERECSSKEAFSYSLTAPVSSLHLPYFCLSEVLRATLRETETWLSILRRGREAESSH